MIVLLTEEKSMRECLKVIIPQLWPDSIEGLNWFVLSFQGKSDLKKSIPKKMKGWKNYGDPHFIILQDNDGEDDCLKTKQELCTIANPYDKPFHVRIVCQELESWLLGDPEAIRRAYPEARIRARAKFRKPDKLGNASQELGRLINIQTKVQRAQNISQHLDLTKNNSKSFNVFIKTLQQLIQEEQSRSKA